MAFKNVTTGLTDLNAVINEIITFCTTDLSAPWTLELNNEPTASDAGIYTSGTTGRLTILSKTPSQPNVMSCFNDPANPFLPSPAPDRMYVKLRNVTEPGVQMCPSGYADPALESPMVFLEQTTGLQPSALFDARTVNLSTTTTQLPVVETNGKSTSFTQMWLFGPNQASPEDPRIPNYVYFVIETEPGRYTHGFFGEVRKMVPWSGGFGAHGHDRSTSDNVNLSSNATMWNQDDAGSGADKTYFCADVGNQQTGFISASPEPTTKWWSKFLRGTSGWADSPTGNRPHNAMVMGHNSFKRFMDGTGISLLSGFVPLATPMMFAMDEYVAVNIADRDAPVMPMYYMPDMWLGPIDTFEPGVQVTVGGITVIPFPITSTLGTAPASSFGAYLYRVRT